MFYGSIYHGFLRRKALAQVVVLRHEVIQELILKAAGLSCHFTKFLLCFPELKKPK